MMYLKLKSVIRQYWIFYFIGFVVIFGIKYYYSNAGIHDLIWILTPTSWWVRILSGITFEYEPHIGFINHHIQFIIGASCSGVQFMIITIATLVYSFVHRMETWKKGFYWIGLSIIFSYAFTIFLNGIRIVLSIYIPLFLHSSDSYSEWMTPERLHTVIGIVVYFTSLFTIYHIAGYMTQSMDDMFVRPTDRISLKYRKSNLLLIRRCVPPVFWYFAIVLGIPVLNRSYTRDFAGFIEYATLMTVLCLAVILLFYLIYMIRKYIMKQRKSRHNLTFYRMKNR